MNENETQSEILSEIVRLIEKLHNAEFSPVIHGIELIVFGDRKEELFDFIRRFSVLKRPENIRQILYWKLNTLGGKERPLSGIPPETALMLYNSIFNQREIIGKSNTPINVILFRRGTSGQQLTDILKTLPRKEILNGLAEIIKHAVIADKKLFDFLEKNIVESREK